MLGSLIIVTFFVLGAVLGRFVEMPGFITENDPTLYALYVLMFLVGVSIGSDKKALRALRQQNIIGSAGNNSGNIGRFCLD